MEFREIKIEDYEILIPFWKENYFVSEMDNLERFKLFLKKNPGLSFLAEEGGEVLGTALGSFDGRRGYLQKLVVRKDARRKGLGQKLVEKVIEELKKLDVLYIPINVNDDLVNFYEQCGFKKTDQIPMNMELK
jgi:ribosomal protein S18 acetylase RimI-like enzyme